MGIRLSAQALPAEREMRGVSGDGVEGEEGEKIQCGYLEGRGLFKRKGTGERCEDQQGLERSSERKDFFFFSGPLFFLPRLQSRLGIFSRSRNF